MPFEKFDLENLDKERRKAVANSIRTMSVEELKALGNEIFRYADDPWREKFFGFIAENPGATFHHAVMSDGVNIVYCRDQGKGMDMAKIPDPLAPENLLKTSGRGIFLIRSFMDSVEIHPSQSGTEIKLIKHVHGPSEGGKEASQ